MKRDTYRADMRAALAEVRKILEPVNMRGLSTEEQAFWRRLEKLLITGLQILAERNATPAARQ